jgi:hypothetical protein
MSGGRMTIPRDVLRFEVLLYLSLILDCLSAAFFGPSGATADARASLSVVNIFLITGFFALVWLAAQRRKNWARWTLFGFFVFTVVVYIASMGELSFGLQTMLDMVSLALSAFAFYFGFTSQAQKWFRASPT